MAAVAGFGQERPTADGGFPAANLPGSRLAGWSAYCCNRCCKGAIPIQCL